MICNCKDCPAWRYREESNGMSIGSCHARPPRVTGEGDGTYFPRVEANAGCILGTLLRSFSGQLPRIIEFMVRTMEGDVR